MSVRIRVYNDSGDDYKDFEGESEECIKSTPKYENLKNTLGWFKGINTIDDRTIYAYRILEGSFSKSLQNYISDLLNDGYEIQSTHALNYGSLKDLEFWHIVHLVRKPINKK